MANSTYDKMWKKAMADLDTQLHIEDDSLDQPEGSRSHKPPTPSITDAFNHYATLYIKYLMIFRDLCECHHNMLHPQKRMDIKSVLEVVMWRVVELRHLMTKWCPPLQEARSTPEKPFPWEYVDLDNILVDLKLSPETLEVPMPSYFLEENAETRSLRDAMIEGFVSLQWKRNHLPVEEKENNPWNNEMSVEEAIAIIQRNERGRQGWDRTRQAAAAMASRESTSYRKSRAEKDSAAAQIQKLFRGHRDRGMTKRMREQDLIFLGMAVDKGHAEEKAMENEEETAVDHRKLLQKQFWDEYRKALVDLRKEMEDESGPRIKEEMREERKSWYTAKMELGEFPDTLEGFYAEKAEREAGSNPTATPRPGSGGSVEDGRQAEAEGASTLASKVEPTLTEAEKAAGCPPCLTGRTALTEALQSVLRTFEDKWLGRDESHNFAQKHDSELAKEVLRGPMLADLQKEVDEEILSQLQKLKIQLDGAAEASGKKKTKKGEGAKGAKETKNKKGGDKDGKDKKGKGGKSEGKAKGVKAKKGKALPGDKIAEISAMTAEDMLHSLVENRMINTPRDLRLKDFLGELDLLGSIYRQAHAQSNSSGNAWSFREPSLAHVRQMMSHYAALPLGSSMVRQRTSLVPSILLYGLPGTGKTTLVEAIAKETGALFVNLSPEVMQGRFPGKTGATKAVHMAFRLARDPALAPIIVYIDSVEQVFPNAANKKKQSSDGPARFKSDLLAYIGAVTPEERVLVIGCTSNPQSADIKDLKKAFRKFIYIPHPDHAARLLLWKTKLIQKAQACKEGEDILDDVNISTLSRISEGYTAGAICQAVDSVLSERRLKSMKARPLQMDELVSALANGFKVYTEDLDKMRNFTADITGLKQARDGGKEESSGKADEAATKKGKKK